MHVIHYASDVKIWKHIFKTSKEQKESKELVRIKEGAYY